MGAPSFGIAHDLSTALAGLGLCSTERAELARRMRGGTIGLMIYGSRARGDYVTESDFDLLRLARVGMPTFRVGRASISSYTPAQLRTANRTLFGTHLARDGQVVFDPTGKLGAIVGELEAAHPGELLMTVSRYSTILDLPRDEKITHCSGLVRLARYLLRTAIYAEAMRIGNACFSVRELADRFNDPCLVKLLASDPEVTGPPSIDVLDELGERLSQVVGRLPRNEFGSLEALAVASWESDKNLSALATRAASEDEDTFDYTDLPKVLL